MHSDGTIAYSLRSCAEYAGHVDVSEVARQFGGGGHRHAAGFRAASIVHEIVDAPCDPHRTVLG